MEIWLFKGFIEPSVRPGLRGAKPGATHSLRSHQSGHRDDAGLERNRPARPGGWPRSRRHDLRVFRASQAGRKKIAEGQAPPDGNGMAVSGLIMGCITIALTALGIIAVIVLIAVAGVYGV